MEKSLLNLNYVSAGHLEDVLVFLTQLEGYSHETFTHSIDVANRSLNLGKKMGLNRNELVDLYTASLVHDVGKLAVPLDILENNSLTPEGKRRIQFVHINGTYELLKNKFNENIREIAYRHHEKLNGRGYPRGLTAKELTISDRIIAVADITSAILMKRSYKDPMSIEDCVNILGDMVKKGELDKRVVDTYVKELKTHNAENKSQEM